MKTMPEEIVRIFKALADETRFRLLNLLLTHDLCVGALARHLGISEAAVSQHLRLFRLAGLVRGEKRGYWTHYTADRNMLRALAQGLTELADLPPCRESACPKNPERPNNCHEKEEIMCDCKCQHPEKLKTKPAECSPERIKECHGDKAHPCEEKKRTSK